MSLYFQCFVYFKTQNGSTSSPKLPDPIGKERANSIPVSLYSVLLLCTVYYLLFCFNIVFMCKLWLFCSNFHYIFFCYQSNNLVGNAHLHASSPLPEPIGKGRSSSTSSSITSDSGFYQRFPGSEREDSQMVSVSRNVDDTLHRHLMFLMVHCSVGKVSWPFQSAVEGLAWSFHFCSI